MSSFFSNLLGCTPPVPCISQCISQQGYYNNSNIDNLNRIIPVNEQQTISPCLPPLIEEDDVSILL